MRLPPAQQAPGRESGFALIEVLVSALVVVIVGGAVLTLLQTTARSAGDERRHATAFALAQEDQSRLRTSRLATLNKLEQQRTVVVNGQTYTVESRGVFVNGSTGTASCTDGYESADYAKATSVVTWQGARKPVRIESLIAPSSGSLDPTHGTLTISATNAAGEPLAGVSLSGTGSGTFSGSTDESGCATFTDLPEGNYTMTTSANGLVDENGDAIGSRLVGVVASSTQTVLLRFDNPGRAKVNFTYRNDSTGVVVAAKIDSMFLYHPELSPGTVKGDPGGPATSRQTSLETELFPFTSPYTVYAGSCTSNNPNPKEEAEAPGEAAMAGITVPSGGFAEATIQVPALYVTVKYGSSLVKGAEVVISDDECKDGYSYVEREYTSNSSGQQAKDSVSPTEPALPWGRYNVCAAAYLSERYRRQRAYNVDVKNLSSGTYVTVDLGGYGADSSKYTHYTC